MLTLITCWYNVKSKFNASQYDEWIGNMIAVLNNVNVVIYSNDESYHILTTHITNKPNIKLVIKPMESFHTYKYKNNWIKNHEKSGLELHNNIDWRLNMLWSEKVFFIEDAISNGYFNTEYYGWCDIGYFRNRIIDLHTSLLVGWPNTNKINSMSNHIHYGCVQNNRDIYTQLVNDVRKHYNQNEKCHPVKRLLDVCFAGGFFIANRRLIHIYSKLYEEKLRYYFDNDYVIKDDQTIIMDIIFNNPQLFFIHMENDPRFDNWFMFQRILF